MNRDQTVPVLVGISQLEQRVADPAQAKEPLALMIDAVRAAAADAGSNSLLNHATSVRVIRGIWPYKDPARIVAQAVGVPNAETALTPYGGNYVQSTVNQSALDIQAQRHEVIVITGAECGYTQARARKQGIDLKWQEAPGTPDRLIGEDKNMRHDAEKAVGLGQPIQLYPLFENALRYARHESIPAHLKRISELWARFSDVASSQSARVDSGAPHRGRNPHAVGVESTGVVSVSEADELEQQRRSGGGADHVLGRRGEALRHSGRSLDLSVGRHRRARPLLRLQSRQPALVTGDPLRRRALSRTGRRHREERSTTSICTAAFRSPSKSPRPNSDSTNGAR